MMLVGESHMNEFSFTKILSWPRFVLLQNSENFLLFLRVITELNPFVVMKDKFTDLNIVGDLFPHSGFDRMPSEY